MSYFTLEHLTHSLEYLNKSGHPQLLTLLAALRAELPVTEDDGEAQPFGAREENVLLLDHFKPTGGPEEKPFYVPFAFELGTTTSPWRDTSYASRSLQRMRKDRQNAGIVFRQAGSDNKRWSFLPICLT